MNPHCEHCRDERNDAKICNTCEALRLQVEDLKYHNKKLLEALLDATRKEAEVIRTPPSLNELKPLSTGSLPWPARKQALEIESRKKAQQNEITAEEMILRDKMLREEKATGFVLVSDIAKLEEYVGIREAKDAS